MGSPDNALLEALDEGLKAGTVAAIGTFPIVGGLAAAFLEKVYSGQAEEKNQKALVDMENRIMDYCAKLVDRAHLASVRGIIAGQERLVNEYVHKKAPEKGTHLTILCDSLLAKVDAIYGKIENPERHYLLFLTFATLHLTALRDVAYCWNAAYMNPVSNVPQLPNNNADEHTKDLFEWHEKYIGYLADIRDRLLAWRRNNISDSIAEGTHWYQDGQGGNTYIDFEWHDTITDLKWYTSTLDAGYTEEDAAETRRRRAQDALQNYRKGMEDTRNKTFNHEGKNIESAAYRLAHELEPAKLWKYCCHPQGQQSGQAQWTGLQLTADSNNKVILVWTLTSRMNELAAPVFKFPLQDYLSFNEQGMPVWGVSGTWPDNWRTFDLRGTDLKANVWGLNLGERLAVVPDGELRFLPKALRELSDWTWGLD